jgi:polyisoprenoid-binding protein YceI
MNARLFASILLVPSLALPAPLRRSLPAATATPATFTIDPVHSGVSFQIRHFVSRVRGSFKDVKGTITATPDAWQDAVIDVTIATASVSTENEKRDAHLRSNDFFAADSFPAITFRSTRVERKGDDAKVFGNLTIRGITRPVVLDGHFSGLMTTAQGQRVGFEATTTIDRTAYGVTWNRAAEGGGAMLGDEVKIEINVEANSVRR